jgi:hypothetical protein
MHSKTNTLSVAALLGGYPGIGTVARESYFESDFLVI